MSAAADPATTSGTASATAFRPEDYAALDEALAETDELLARAYPGDDGSRQPVHTVYVPADKYEPSLPGAWGTEALAAVEQAGGMEALCRNLGFDDRLTSRIASKASAKLGAEPVEDLRLDFEDGYGHRPDDEEDADAVRAGRLVAEAVQAGTAPPFVGIRFKCFEADTRRRGLRTLDLFVSTLAEAGSLPDGLVLTLPKVSTAAQVEAMVAACRRLESAHGLDEGRLRFEVQMETPQLILAADGTVPVAQLLHRGAGRITALHYGTYDYSDALQIAAQYQSMEHPAADYAKEVMQVAVAGTGVRLSDGSTNIIPAGSDEQKQQAWQLHARLVRRHLERGYYQGWDMHPAQLPTRFLATYAFYRQGWEAAARRLHNYVHQVASEVMDEPATARALARFAHRGLLCGAVSAAELDSDVGISEAELFALAHPKAAH
ncbi:DUF6986 family protein [Arthrobacter castelli]|uniref:DUF6986 family protein n=1 Tax=Arthrobacter castelli TaxID=271431 RepID=UPI000426FFAD|nr:aldolase/citrate lyase family protein [Arthrobacter castelli]